MSPFNAAAWNGTRPLVAPMPTPLTIGTVVWERNDMADDPESKAERRGGVIIARRVDPGTGEVEQVSVLRGQVRQGAYTVHRVDLAVADLDPALSQPPTVDKIEATARAICRHLGDHWRARRFSGFDRWLLEVAGGLLVLAAELQAEQSARRAS